MEIIAVKNVDEVLKIALTKILKELNGLKLNNCPKKNKEETKSTY